MKFIPNRLRRSTTYNEGLRPVIPYGREDVELMIMRIILQNSSDGIIRNRYSIRPKGFQVNAQPIGQTVYKRVIADDLIDVQNRGVAESCLAQGNYVALDDAPRLQRELGSIFEHCTRRFIYRRSAKIGYQLFDKFFISRQLTETRPVMLHSIDAMVEHGNHDRDHLSTSAGQITASGHYRFVKFEMRRHRGRIETVNF